VPYEVKKSGSCPADKPFGVFKQGSDKSLGCHASDAAAKSQLRALYAQEATTDPTGELAGTFKAREVFPASEAVFTQEADGPVRADIVIIKPGESKNRRIYSSDAIRQAVEDGIWENSPMFVDHPDDMRVPHKRKVRDMVAGLTDIRVGPAGEAIGTATFYNRDFGKFAREAKDHVGVSPVHFFQGQRFRGSDGHYHERVDKVLVNHSVDFVAFPAAGGGIMNFLPAQESEDDVEWPEITREMIEQHRPDLVQAILATASEGEGDPAGDKGEQKQPEAKKVEDKKVETRTEETVPVSEVKRIASEAVEEALRVRSVAESEREAARSKVKNTLDKSGLPQRTRERLLGHLLGADNFENIEAMASEAIEDARTELKEAGAGPRVTGMGPSAAGGQPKTITMNDAASRSTALGQLAQAMGGGQPQTGKES
jgi:hypothetical protein